MPVPHHELRMGLKPKMQWCARGAPGMGYPGLAINAAAVGVLADLYNVGMSALDISPSFL